jgi:hypothetical protein
MKPPFPPLLYSALMFIGMLIMLEVGRRLAGRKQDSANEGLGTIEASVFALFGLLIAFTFSGAATRFQEKRMLVAQEASVIRTAYLRVDLVTREHQPAVRELFRQYLDSRLETYRKLPDIKAAAVEMERSKQLQNGIWAAVITEAGIPGAPTSITFLLLPALNQMFDIAEIRSMALHVHPPAIIYLLLFALGLLCSVLAGFRMAHRPQRDWLHILAFVVFTTLVINTMLDVEYPRVGLIRLAEADQALLDLRESMK